MLALPDIKQLTGDYLHNWSEMCGAFLAWEQQHILDNNPAPKEEDAHRECLKWLLRFTRLLQSMGADPDFPDRDIASELEGRRLQLESSWRMFYEPLAPEHARNMLAQVFPE
jgi:hypothetical protein